MRKYHFCMSPQEYARFCHHPSTRLYLRSYKDAHITVQTNNVNSLAKDLMHIVKLDNVKAAKQLLLSSEIKIKEVSINR